MSTAEPLEKANAAPNTAATAAASAAKVVRVTPAIAEPLAAFFCEAWGDTRGADDLRRTMISDAANNPSVPGADAPAIAFLNGDSVVGYIGNIPVTFWNGATETPAHWTKPFMVLEAYRNGPVGFSILREVLKHIGLSALITVAVPARRLFTAVGYKDCGILPNHIAPLRPGRIARSIDVGALGLGLPSWMDRLAKLGQQTGLAGIAGGLGGVGLSAFRSLRGGAGGGMSVDLSGTLPPKP
ncbi:MAG TPA: hypothetical protein VHV78_14125, partial [Gemmatimonadaceae bacterium]|nr:hypothetical protein [Gemmatimonadaceae bacterium]